MSGEQAYLIKVVSRRTGLTQHVIRAWERRYSSVTPARTATNRRLYSEDDIERLRLLHQLRQAGHSIGRISMLTTEQLTGLLETELETGESSRERVMQIQRGASPLEQSLAAIRRLDADSLDSILQQSATLFGEADFSDELIVPLVQEIGTLWARGRLGIANEHLAIALTRSVLGARLSGTRAQPGAPVLLSTTPAREAHELGALLVATNAAAFGWKAVFLGPNLPAEDIASACKDHRARVLALSIVHVEDRGSLAGEIKMVGRLVPKSTRILAGGRDATLLADELREIGAFLLEDLASLRQHLQTMLSETPGL